MSSAEGEAVDEAPLVPVPAVTGVHPQAAERRLRHWHFETEYGVLSNVCAGLPPGGRILLQKPTAGTLAPAFSTVTLHDSCHRRGPRKRVRVPDVSHGETVFTAYERLRQRGLRVSIPRRFSLAALCLPGPGAQMPRPGATVARGRVVRLTRLGCAVGSPGGQNPRPTSKSPI